MFSIILLFLAILLYWKKSQNPGKYSFPDGPNGIPILGNLLQLIFRPHLQLSRWAYKYGHLYTLRIAGRPALVLNDAQTMKQVFGTMESTGRFSFYVLDEINEGVRGGGIMSAEGHTWQELRTFVMKALKEFGTSRRSVVEPAVIEEGQRVIKWIENEANRNQSSVVVGFRETFIKSMSNYTWTILNRQTDGSSSSDMGTLVLRIIEMMNVTTNSGLLFLPWLRHIAPEWSGYRGLMESCRNMRNKVQTYFDKRVLERQRCKIEPENRNLLDAFLDQWENCKDPKSCFYGKAGWKQCFYSVVHILIAAAETQAGTLNWVINYLVAHPEIQEKLYQELNNVLEGNKTLSLADKPKLPYLEAVIMETLRMSSTLPMGVIHRLLNDTQIGKYLVPKDTLLIANIYHANMDKSIWHDADVFRPDRFLEVGKLKENVATFQPGKRVCPGEKLAKDAVFLFVGMLVQKFKFLPAPGKIASEYVNPAPGYILLPTKIGVQFKARL